MTHDESARPDEQIGADEQVSQIDEDLEETAEPGGGVPEFPVDPPDVPAPMP